MADVKRLTTKPKRDLVKERRLTVDNEGLPQPDTSRQKRDKAVELVNNFQKVQDKAKAIRAEAKRLAVVRNIPVDQRAKEVRAAVNRQDPGSQGVFITFDLYERSLAYVNRQRESLPPEVLDVITGDPVTDNDTVGEILLASVEGVTADQAALLASQIIILFVLKLLQTGLDNLDAGKQTALKTPVGSELASIAVGLAVSVAAQQLYAGLNAAEIQASMDEVAPGTKIDTAAVEKAKGELQNSELFQTALKARRPSDYALIIQYADAFLNRQTEPGWESWQSVGMLDETITWNDTVTTELSRYAEEATARTTEPRNAANTFFTNAVTFSTQRDGTPTPTMSDSIFQVYVKNLLSVNRTVDKIGHLMGSALSAVDVCCLLRFFELQDIETLKEMKIYLQAFQNTMVALDNLGASNQFRGQLTISAAIHQAIMMMLQDLEEGAVKKIKRWFQSNEERWVELMECFLIEDLYTYLVRFIDRLKQTISVLLEKYLGYIEDQEQKVDVELNTLGNQIRIRAIMNIIDEVIEFTGPFAGECSDAPDPGRLIQSARRVIDGLGPSASIPLNGDPFSTVASPPVTLDTGRQMPAVNGNPSEQDISDAARQVCRDGVVDMNLVPFPRVNRSTDET